MNCSLLELQIFQLDGTASNSIAVKIIGYSEAKLFQGITRSMAAPPINSRRALGARLRAARLISGKATIQEAADEMSIPASTLRAVEGGHRPMTSAIRWSVKRIYNMDEGAIESGTPYSDRDRLMVRLAGILLHPDVAGLKGDAKGVFGGRLNRLRKKAGFRSATAAAKQFNWKLSSYVAYEGRSEKMSLDRLVVFAQAFTDDLESFFLPAPAVVAPAAPAADLVGEQDFPDWLAPQPERGPIDIPVVLRSLARLHLSPDRIVLPREMVRYDVTGTRLFALQMMRDSWRRIWLFDYRLHDRPEETWILRDAELHKIGRRSEIVRSDFIGHFSSRSLLIGTAICELGGEAWV